VHSSVLPVLVRDFSPPYVSASGNTARLNNATYIVFGISVLLASNCFNDGPASIRGDSIDLPWIEKGLEVLGIMSENSAVRHIRNFLRERLEDLLAPGSLVETNVGGDAQGTPREYDQMASLGNVLFQDNNPLGFEGHIFTLFDQAFTLNNVSGSTPETETPWNI